MKKQLLLGSALLAAISVYPQNGRKYIKPAGFTNIAERIAAKFAVEPIGAPASNLKQAMGPVENPNSSNEKTTSLPPSTINWKLIGGCSNIYGMLVSQSRPLQYNNDVNAVSFIHRRSATYVPTPAPPAGALSGVIMADISTNWGNTWDSTVLWADATDWGRYPQGAIYNPSGNTAIGNAYVVGAGPTVAGSNFSGNWYASRKLNSFTTTLDATPGAQKFIPFGSTAPVAPHGWSRMGFSSTDDGIVRSLALIEDDPTGLSTVRGAAVVKGVFSAGAFTWSTDSLIPPTTIQSDASKNVLSAPQMVWNESGTTGYVIFIGSRSGATNSNLGFQPIVYKTTNSGTSWSLISGIDFNSPAMAPVIASVNGVSTNSALAIPFFNDFDATVDANGKLHIGATFFSTFSSHLDSLTFSQGFTVSINPGEQYNWTHTPGMRPYLYDFIGDGTAAWQAVLIDSLATEAPSAQTGGFGFNDNPWDATGSGEPVKTDNVDSRIQLGRTPDGQYITFAFAESDTNFTNGSRKYNSLPNIKTRLMSIGTGTAMYKVAGTEVNTTKVAAGTGTNNPNVASRATLHYMSPTTGAATVTLAGNGFPLVDVYTPMVVTNSNPFAQLTNNTIWYQAGKLSYDFNNAGVGVKENAQNSASNSVIYPNPASNNATLVIDMKDNSSVDITVMNAVGQVVKTNKAQAQAGQNSINIDLNGLSTGIYMVNVKVGGATSTKKLIVQ
jgi:hypothetical protein